MTCFTHYRFIYYRPKRSCGKVMFLHLSVSHSVHRGEGVCRVPVQADCRSGGGGLDRPSLDTNRPTQTWGMLGRPSPWMQTIPRQTPLDGNLSHSYPSPPPRYINKRVVRNLVECILAKMIYLEGLFRVVLQVKPTTRNE